MRVIMPFNYIDEYYWERYKDQIQPIADRVEGFTIVSNTGVTPENTGKVEVIIHGKARRPRGLPEMAVRHFFSFQGLIIARKIWRRHKITEDLKSVDGDLVYGFSGGAYQQCVHILLKNKKGVPGVHRMRGNAKLELKHVVNGIMKIALAHISDCTMLMYDRHVPINTHYYKLLRLYDIPREQISRPIGLGVDTESFTPRSESDGFTLGYFGRLSPEKGTRFMLDLMRKTPDTRYLVVGKNIMDVKFPRNVEYHRPVHHRDMPRYYSKVDAVLLPSYAEGVSNIFPESYASGKPVICSHAAYPEDIPLYGVKLPHRLNAWIETIRSLDKPTAQEWGTRARVWAEGYTWDIFAEKMITEFKKVIRHDDTLDRAHGIPAQPLDIVPRTRSNP